MSKRLVADGYIAAKSSKFLIRELRESQPYLADEGWHQVASLMLAAADEIEQLHARIGELEAATQKH
jgi:nucleoside-specific outer membrane channel protein Tsx